MNSGCSNVLIKQGLKLYFFLQPEGLQCFCGRNINAVNGAILNIFLTCGSIP